MKYKYILIIYLIAMAILFSGCVRPDPYVPPVVPNDTPNTTTLVVVEEIPETVVETNLTPPVEVPPRKVTGFWQGQFPQVTNLFYSGVGDGCISDNFTVEDFGYQDEKYYTFESINYICTSGNHMKFTVLHTENNMASLIKSWIEDNYPNAQLSLEGEEYAKRIIVQTANSNAKIVYSSAPAYSTAYILETIYVDSQNVLSTEKSDFDKLTKKYLDTHMVYSEAQKSEYFTNDGFVLEKGMYYGIGDTCNSNLFQKGHHGDSEVNTVTFDADQLFYRCNGERNHVFVILTPSNVDDMVFSTRYHFSWSKSKSDVVMETVNGQKTLKSSKSGDYPYTLWAWHDNSKIYYFEIGGDLGSLSSTEHDELNKLLEEYVKLYPSTVSGDSEDYMN